jgi:hypothetical protein
MHQFNEVQIGLTDLVLQYVYHASVSSTKGLLEINFAAYVIFGDIFAHLCVGKPSWIIGEVTMFPSHITKMRPSFFGTNSLVSFLRLCLLFL